MRFDEHIQSATVFLGQGGLVLWLLAGLSMLTLATALYKLLQIAPYALRKSGLTHHLDLTVCSPEQALGLASDRLTRLRGGFGLLDLLYNIAPLLGLLGTIIGMIEAFQALEAAGNSVSPSQLAGGIWTALLTTAAGLVVAMLALLCLNGLESLLETIRRNTQAALQAHYSKTSAHAAS